MSADIWRHLGIAETNDEAEVRRAYAQRLKLTNPEDDPEGFKRLRSAYERALENIRWRARYAAAEDDEEAASFDAFDAVAEAPISFDVAERTTDELEHDELAENHRALRAKLLGAVSGSPWEVEAAFSALVNDAAMERLSVYASTEVWLANLVRDHGRGGPLFDLAAKHFKWGEGASEVRGGVGETMRHFRQSMADEAEARAFLARVKDKRHEFHAAYREVSTPLGNWLSRILSFPQMNLVRRFLDYVEDKAPYAERDLDWGKIDWWRGRINFWLTPFWVLGWIVRVGVVLGVIALFIALSSSPEGVTNSAENPYTARRACAASVLDIANMDASACDATLRLMPDSLLMRQYAGIISLRAGRLSEALAHFEAISAISPMDAVARFGQGLVLSRSEDADERARGMAEMGGALALDIGVAAYFVAYGLPAPAAISPARDLPTMTRPPAPVADTGPADLRIEDPNVFTAAYEHFGVEQHYEDGRVVLLCLARITGSLTNCQIEEETPRNSARGEMALRIIASAHITPAQKDGAPVDAVPIRVPLRFNVE
ncbi:MAG TPA: hypothetical protein PKY87_01010 [Terricaulis sp.]|nr:hypothetical protein [Terricaulis sp.]